MFQVDKPLCPKVVIDGALVPQITSCFLKTDNALTIKVGQYVNGYWTEPDGTISLPFEFIHGPNAEVGDISQSVLRINPSNPDDTRFVIVWRKVQ